MGLSLKLAPQKRASATNGRGKATPGALDFLVGTRHQRVHSSIAFSFGAQLRHPSHDRRCRMTRGFHPVALAHLPRPVAFAPRQNSSLSREPPGGRAAYSSEPHLRRKSGQKQGFITRMKAEPIDQIAGDCCDLLSRRVKEWQSHRALVGNAVRKSSTSLRLGWRPAHHLTNGTMAATRIRTQSQQ